MHYLYIMGRYSEALRCGQMAFERLSFIAQFREEVGSYSYISHISWIFSRFFFDSAEFHFVYSLTLLALCKAAQSFVTPKARVRELATGWRDAEKNMELKKGDARRKSLEKQRRRKRKEKLAHQRSLDRNSGAGSGGLANFGGGGHHQLPLQQGLVLTKEDYESYKVIVAENQAKLKEWADTAPCNFAHQYLLVEVR
jgi:hypothetical protein